MKNLAGGGECDDYILNELTAAGITPVKVPLTQSEVPFTVVGELGDFKFTRAWYYWVVEGLVPEEAAIQLFATKKSKRDIRPYGHCDYGDKLTTYPHTFVPEDFIGNLMVENKDAGLPATMRLQEAFDALPKTVTKYVQNYHIDTQEGLNFFVATLKFHGLNMKGIEIE